MQKKSSTSLNSQIEKIGRHNRIRKSPRPVKNGKVRRVKISLTETKQGSALKTFPGRKKNREVMRLLQKLFPIFLLLFRLARHQLLSFEKSGLNLVLEYERGGGSSVRRAMPLTLNYFPFRSIFPPL